MIKEQGSFVRECGENYGNYGNGGGYNRTDRALGVIGTVFGSVALASLWGRNNGGIGSILGGGGGSGVPTNVNINGGFGGGQVAPTAFEAYKHECEDVLALTSAFYNQRINSLQEASAARNVDVAEKFGLYKDNRDNIDGLNNRINNELFSLYKYTRDKDDETNARLAKLEQEVAVNTAIRPYQDKIITSEIATAYANAINYVDRKTCKMVSGTVVIPSTPTITGYGSYCCGAASAAEAAG